VTTTISSKGQITVPVKIREALALRPGVKLSIRLSKNSAFIVSKASEKSFFAQFKGRCQRKASWKNSEIALKELRGSVRPDEVDPR
jgi:antitoxin PrlF